MMQKIEKGTSCEIELGNKKRKIFLKVFFDPFEIWIDTKGLPQEAFVCMLCDATPMFESECGSKSNLKRIFVNIEWAINDWGGDQEIVDALKKRKQMIIDDLPRLKQKYGTI